MRPSDIIELKREQIRELTKQHRSVNPRVFGSVLHGSDKEGSDLDLLVDALPGATLFDLGALQIDLEQLLGIPVDVRTPKDLPVSFRSTVLLEARAV